MAGTARRRTSKVRSSPDPNFKKWASFAREGQYWRIVPGTHSCVILGEPVYVEKQFGKRTSEGVDIPTDKGTLSTGNRAFLAALAEYDEGRSIVNRTVKFKVTGEGIERRMEILSIK